MYTMVLEVNSPWLIPIIFGSEACAGEAWLGTDFVGLGREALATAA